MIVSTDQTALDTDAASHGQAPGKTPDWQALYHALLAQVMAQTETMVADAFAAQATEYDLPIPAVVAAALRAAAAKAAPPPASNAALDALNEHLRESAPTLRQASVPPPPWLQPFTLPEKVRFTRTPDPVMRWERALPSAEELAARAQEAARAAAEEAARIAREDLERTRTAMLSSDPATPAWRRPFTLPPNVRYTRTPDPKLPRADEPKGEDAPAGQDTRVDSSTQMQEAVSTHEVHDGAFRSVTVTKTVTTVEATTMASIQPDFSTREMSRGEATAGALPAEVDLPGWFGIMRPGVTVAIPTEQDNRTEAVAAPETGFEDADSEGSGALGRAFFDAEEAQPIAVAAAERPADDAVDADADGGGAFFRAAFLPDLDESEPVAPAVVPTKQVPPSTRVVMPEVRAFASHGISGFETAMHVASDPDSYEHPSIDLLAPPHKHDGVALTREALEQNARLLEGVLEDFGIRGEIIAVRPGPVVTLYELEPAPGVKSSRVVNLADDIARSMSAISARVAVVQGRNVIGIELPNERRETVFLRELVGSPDFDEASHKLAIALGKTIGGESVIVDLARMPHLLVAGTTGSGKSVAINTMILSLLYRLTPEECRLIMVDPKMLELSIYDGIPHLLTPVVTDSKKAVIALKWAVREMEDRYKKMAKVGVRNIDGFNARVAEAKERGEVITRTVQQGFDRETGEAVYATEEMDLARLPYIVIIVDEMADLMMVAGKEIEGAIQRLAQMARAAGIHLIMATQRPSVDVITGTIKANFPTRISFQVTSKIDSRTILGEMGAEQLLGQGDMLHMAGGGRIVRVHGPFVSDGEVEKVVWHLKSQGHPEYLDVVTADEEDAEDDEDLDADAAVFDKGNFGEEGSDLYDQAVKVVLRDKKCSTSYIQRRLQIGYNKAASLVERMEREGLVGPANPTGKREILNYNRDHSRVIFMPGGED